MSATITDVVSRFRPEQREMYERLRAKYARDMVERHYPAARAALAREMGRPPTAAEFDAYLRSEEPDAPEVLAAEAAYLAKQ